MSRKDKNPHRLKTHQDTCQCLSCAIARVWDAGYLAAAGSITFTKKEKTVIYNVISDRLGDVWHPCTKNSIEVMEAIQRKLRGEK